jgi:FAD/FMN-containing dehydrogenase
MSSAYPIEEFCRSLGGIPYSVDPVEVRRKSRDYFAISPLLRRELMGKVADVVVTPRDKPELIGAIRAAVLHRIPITVRGGGTANYGQSVPLHGGVLLDMTGLAGVLWVRDGRVRTYAGTMMDAVDAVTRPQGWELRIHSSTRSTATIGGFIGGGSGGMGSCQWGMLRERGNIGALEVISAEDEPRTIELRGRDIELVHHAYGTNGIISEIEMPLAPAWNWHETIVAFPEFMKAARFGVTLAHESGIIKKLISLQEWPVATLMKELSEIVPAGHSMANCMIADVSMTAFEDLVSDFGGRIVSDCGEAAGPYGAPLYEFAYGHGLKQIQKTNPVYTGLQGMFPGSDLLGSLERVRNRFADKMPIRVEVFWSNGTVVAMGSPLIFYESQNQMSEIVLAMQSEGVNVANSHTTGIREVGIKRITERDAAFKTSMDPHNLLNPGKVDFSSSAQVVKNLPTTGWSFQTAS